jgi:concanavalin A-like lectin/glucanase superfamily protein
MKETKWQKAHWRLTKIHMAHHEHGNPSAAGSGKESCMSWGRIGIALVLMAALGAQVWSGKAFGQEGFALKFDGIDDFVSIPDAGDFDFGTAFSVEAWVKPSSLSGGGFRAIVRGAFAEPPAASGGGWVMYLDSGAASAFGLSVCVPACNAAESPADTLRIGEWQHLATSYDGTIIRAFRNGESVGTASWSGDVTDVDFVLLGVWDKSFAGEMDEVRLWNTARSQAEIQANMDRRLAGDEPGLVAYWDFDEGDGQVVSDVASNRNHGRLGSSAAADDRDPIWVRVSDRAIFLRGDCDGDGSVGGQVTDAVFLLDHNFRGGGEPPCLAACDADGDGRTEGQVTDAVYLLTFNFQGGPPPLDPFPGCGPVQFETDESLGCETPTGNCPP